MFLAGDPPGLGKMVLPWFSAPAGFSWGLQGGIWEESRHPGSEEALGMGNTAGHSDFLWDKPPPNPGPWLCSDLQEKK